jgi:hypothetical protein
MSTLGDLIYPHKVSSEVVAAMKPNPTLLGGGSCAKVTASIDNTERSDGLPRACF